jgi:hypothetical protein
MPIHGSDRCNRRVSHPDRKLMHSGRTIFALYHLVRAAELMRIFH